MISVAAPLHKPALPVRLTITHDDMTYVLERYDLTGAVGLGADWAQPLNAEVRARKRQPATKRTIRIMKHSEASSHGGKTTQQGSNTNSAVLLSPNRVGPCRERKKKAKQLPRPV
jgi:hypothetical protein